MKFREGNSVEVLRRENDPCGSWFPGTIIAVDGDKYIVRYKLFLDHKEEPLIGKVLGEDVRPQAPHEKGKRWMVGDIAEVFDIHCWRVGKVAKVLKNDHFVVRLFGSIQLKEFHKSNLRIRQAWHDNKWSMIGKVGHKKHIDENLALNNSKYSWSLVCGVPRQAICEETRLKEKHDGPNHFQTFLPMRTLKRIDAYCSEPSPEDLLTGGSLKKRKSSINVGGCEKPLVETLALFKQVDDISSPKLRVDEKCINGSTEMDAKMKKTTNFSLHSSIRPLWSTEDSNQCSVASCSFDEFPNYPSKDSRKSLKNIFGSSDAESSFPSFSRQKHLPPSPRDKLEVDIHKLELRAYKSTVHALYASGPLSWEQESLLTNLRLSLHISNEEHLLQLRHLLSTQVL